MEIRHTVMDVGDRGDRLPVKYSCSFSCRNLPCSSTGSDWFTPSVDQLVADIFLNGNWSMSNPSPGCECGTPKRTMMLPDCPPGAGGLPPPQVSVRLRKSCLSVVQWVDRSVCEFIDLWDRSCATVNVSVSLWGLLSETWSRCLFRGHCTQLDV